MLGGLAGRARELGTLEEAVHRAHAGEGSLFLVAGEPGIGKTTLAEALTARADAARSAWGACWEAGGAPPFWVWSQVARAWGDVSGTVADAGLDAEVLGPILLGGRSDAPEAERFLLFDSFTRLIARLAEEQPLVIVLEDLHAADLPSLLLLRFVARSLRSIPAVVIGTYRPADARAVPEVDAALEEISRDGAVLQLEGLDREAVARMVRAALGTEPAPEVVGRLMATTEGHPLFVRELVRVIDDMPGTLPPRVRSAIAARLQRLPAETRAALEAAAVIGRSFTVELLAGVLREPAGIVRPRLEPALREEVVRGGEPLTFAHALFEEVLREGVAPERLVELHREVARALVDRGQASAAAIAHHLREAGDPAAGRAAERAAQEAEAALAFEEAAALYDQALALHPAIDEGRCRLQLARAAAIIRAGQVPEGQAAYQEAAATARGIVRPDLLALAALGYCDTGIEGGIVNTVAVEMLEDALAAAGELDTALRSRLTARLAAQLTFGDELERRVALSEEAMRLARVAGDPMAQWEVLRAQVTAACTPDNAEERMAWADEMLEIGRGRRDKELMVHANARRCLALLELGRFAEYHAAAGEIRALAPQVRTAHAIWYRQTLDVTALIARGALDEARTLMDSMIQRFADQPNARGAYVNQLFTISLERGRVPELLGLIEMLTEQRPGLRFAYRQLWTLARLSEGRREEALVNIEALLAEFPRLRRDLLWLLSACFLADGVIALGHVEGAAVLWEALLPKRGRHSCSAQMIPCAYWGAVDQRLGGLAFLLGRPDEAIGFYESALRDYAAFGAVCHSVRAQAELAQVLEDRDPARAAALAAEVAAAVERLGIAAPGRIPVPGGPAAGMDADADASLTREGDVWRVAFAGSVVRIADSRGMQHLATLLAHPGRELHVLEVVGSGAGGGEAEGLALATEDGVAVLDAEAKRAIRDRMAELEETADEAERFGDFERASRAREELDRMVEHLAAAVGMGGRDRKLGSLAERERVNVTRAVRRSVERIAKDHPALGEHLAGAVRTGTRCAYRPSDGTRWSVAA